jgi:hypothetical protein
MFDTRASVGATIISHVPRIDSRHATTSWRSLLLQVADRDSGIPYRVRRLGPSKQALDNGVRSAHLRAWARMPAHRQNQGDEG